MKNYQKSKTVSELRLIQLLQLSALKELDRISKKLNLSYFIIAGTLLGSVRHNGFIPWDSDCDVAMYRHDYEIFIRKASENISKDFKIQSKINDKKIKIHFSRIRVASTSFIEDGNMPSKEFDGFYIDIFPLDNKKNLPTIIDSFMNKFIKILIRVQAYRNGKVYSSNVHRSLISAFLNLLFLPIKTETLSSFIENYMRRENESKTKYVTNYNSKYGLKKQTMKKNIYGEFCILDFDGLCVRAPQKYLEWLNKIYGNYHTLPKNTNCEINVVLKGYKYSFGKYKKLLSMNENEVREYLNLADN